MKNLLKVLPLLSVLVLTGCDNTSNNNHTAQPGDENYVAVIDTPVEIEIWTTIGSGNQTAFDTMLDRVRRLEPNITIKNTYQNSMGYDELHDAIVNGFPANNYPDLAYCYPDHVADYINAGKAVNLDTYKVKEIDKYLRENNGLYAMRIKNHGYVNSQTFANEVSRFSSKFLNKVIETGLLPLEYSDRLWCIISFGSCVESAYNEYNGKYARNSKEVLSRANSLFNDVLLETQSNAYAISTSMLRSGELGPIARWVFGTFASDSQNKVSLLYETISNYFNNRSLIRYLENEVGTNTKLSQDEINDYNEKLNSLRSKQPKLRTSMYRNAYTLVASAVLTYAVSLLARYLLGKDKEEDYEVGNLTAGFMQELFVDWLPFISTFSNNIQYNDGKFELMPLENVSAVISDLYNVINQLASGKALNMGNITTLLVDFTNFFGVPLKNAYNIVYGIIDKFSPKTAFEMNNALYSYSQSYIERMQNDTLSKGHFKDGKLYLSENITLYKTGSLSNALINEIATLKNKGFNAIPKNALTSYFDENDNEIELTDLEKQTFVGYYNEVDDVATNLIRSAKYNALTDEEKAELLKKLFDYYYDYAKNMTLNLNEGSRFVKAMTLINNFDISKYLFLKGETKEESVKEVNKIFGTRNERLFALFLLGYNLTNENKKVLYRYLITLGLNRNTAKEWVRIE